MFSKLLASRSLVAPRPFTGQARLLPLLDFLPLLDAIDAARNPDAGAEVGWAIQASAHGPMGLAAMSSASIAHAMETVVRYGQVRNRMFNYRCVRDDRHVSLEITARLDFGDYRGFLQYATLHAIFNIFRVIADERALSQGTLCLPWSRSAGANEPQDVVWSIQHRSSMLAIRFPAQWQINHLLAGTPKHIVGFAALATRNSPNWQGAWARRCGICFTATNPTGQAWSKWPRRLDCRAARWCDGWRTKT
ncbi:MAG: hypothetical protein EOP82_18865 [Variovorax sp.]|nr:MAG: hypothetical protein EOP82_18865 [Variovorax sp.]